jgi:DNA modification methylase
MFEIYQGNCLDVMKELNQKIDCVITDPPYNALDLYGNQRFYWGSLQKYYEAMMRHTDRIAISANDRRSDYISRQMGAKENFEIKNCFQNSRPNAIGDTIFSCKNPIMTQEQFDELENENWDNIPDSVHPNPRNVNKMSKIVKAMSNEGDTVLDPFCGSSAIGITCLLLNRNYIGIELFELYANDSYKRLEEVQKSIES